MSFNITKETAWCPGCGNLSIRQALKKALDELDLSTDDLLVSAGIGQAGKLPQFIDVNAFAGLHGRALPVAIGMKLSNHKMKVLVSGGDGDSLGEGGNHLIHAIRRNIDIVQLVHDNQVYGLTKGQASPTTPQGQKAAMSYTGSRPYPMHPLTLALTMGAGFVARGFAGDIEGLKEIIKEALKFRGYAIIDILQPCPSWNKINTFQWYKERVKPLGDDYDPTDFNKAYELSLKWEDEIPTGILYKKERPIYEENFSFINGDALVDRKLDPKDAQVLIDDLR
ncbi:MAG: 2-oxoacid:ferredoxin oxidoreductase subunit beta [Tissierellia bacterium]|nr:2-oxoacid:ferredoxin oxidoreductase subunit beta [Tissierellia bacterium]